MSNKVHPFDLVITPLLKTIGKVGFDPDLSNFKQKLKWLLLLIFNILWLFLCFGNLMYNASDDIEFADAIIHINGIIQVNFALIVTRLYGKYFKKILNIMQHKFWYDEYKYNNELYIEHNSYYALLSKILKIYLVVGYLACLVVVNPLGLVTRKFSLNIYFPQISFIKTTPYFEVTHILLVFTILSGALYVFFQDLLYTTSIGFALIQIEILKYKLKTVLDGNINENDIKKRLRDCINQHNLIILFLKNIETVCKYVMLNKFICNVIVMCCAKFAYSVYEGTNIKFIFVIMIAGLQPLLYCFFGDFITSRCASIGQAAYEMLWQDLNSKYVKHAVLMLIRDSQKPIYMTAGGMIILSLPNYVAFVKSMFSFYVILEKREHENNI